MIMITIIIKEGRMQTEAAAKRNTRQKSAIESAVLSSCDHPSALTVCERVKEEIPNISLGTVYRVLGMLVKEGKVREIPVPGAPSRFDKTTRTHAHFICTECGERRGRKRVHSSRQSHVSGSGDRRGGNHIQGFMRAL